MTSSEAMSIRRCNALLTFVGRKGAIWRIVGRAARAGVILGVDADPNAAASLAMQPFRTVPPITDRTAYARALLALCDEFHIDCIIPMNDMDLSVLSAGRPAFEAAGVRVLTVPDKIIVRTQDKLFAASWLRENGFSTPRTIAAADAVDDPSLRFPAITKLRSGQGSGGLGLIRTPDELADLPSDAVVQDWIDGEEFHLDILRTGEGTVVAVVPKRKLEMQGGSTVRAVSVDDPELIDLGVKLGRALEHVGSVDVDVMRKDGVDFVLDVNPRLGGGFPFTSIFCPAYVEALLACGAGEGVKPFLGEYRKGVLAYRDFEYLEVRGY